jgi:hypothetical protein
MKSKDKINLNEIKIRKTWKRSPAEQIENPKKGAPYSRTKFKNEIKDLLEEEEDLDFYSEDSGC